MHLSPREGVLHVHRGGYFQFVEDHECCFLEIHGIEMEL